MAETDSAPDSPDSDNLEWSWDGFDEPIASPDLTTFPLKGYKLPSFIPYRVNTTRWAETEDYWPRRLLHIPSMTSYERGEEPVYRGVDRPGYSVLSYTWGRFQSSPLENKYSLAIHNVPWKIPSIQETHFTVNAFQSVLDQITMGTDWVWVDIACIDQENSKVKMDEIGRQAAIFRKATFAYVWLSRVPLQLGFEAIAVIDTVEVAPNVGLAENSARLKTLEDAFGLILSDPWFSSLWTLQELMMRNDAMIISSEGCMVTENEDVLQHNAAGELAFPKANVSRRLMTFSKLCSIWHTQHESLVETAHVIKSGPADPIVTDTKRITADELSTRMIGLTEVLEACGISKLNSNNPNIQYGAAKSRRTIHAEDRVYAIMQIYGLRVGQALRPDDSPCLDALRAEFGLAINTLSVVQGQLFVHTSSPYPGQSWCITEESWVPQDLRDCDDVRNSGVITKDVDGSVFITGQGCSLSSLLDLHDLTIQPWVHSMALQLQIYMDNDVARLLEPHTDPVKHWQWQPPVRVESDRFLPMEADQFGFTNNRHELGQKILDHHGPDNLLLLKLGDIECFGNIYNSGFKKSGLDHLRDQVGQILHRFPRRHVALLLLEQRKHMEGADQASYARLGICTWLTAPLIDDYQPDTPKAAKWEEIKRLIVNAYDEDALQYSEDVRAKFQTQTTVRVV